MISIINYGLGNLGSIMNMFKYLGVDAQIIDSPKQIAIAYKLLLPGVGAFDAGMEQLQAGGWIEPLSAAVQQDKKTILGICLGMQLMTEGSEEGQKPGLGWIKGKAKKFVLPAESKLKIPHMGWTDVEVMKDSSLFAPSEAENRFYFVHSYFVDTADASDVLLQSDYGIKFTSGFQRQNITGVQFHPEKSHTYGKKFLGNFAKL